MSMKYELDLHGVKMGLGAVTGTLVLCTPFVSDNGLANGLVMGKVFWFHLAMLFMAVSTLVMVGIKRDKRIALSLPDGLLIAFAGITLMTYDWLLDPEPENCSLLGNYWCYGFYYAIS